MAVEFARKALMSDVRPTFAEVEAANRRPARHLIPVLKVKMEKPVQPIIIKKVKKAAHGHHGGA